LAICSSHDITDQYNITISARNGKIYYGYGFSTWKEWDTKPTHVFIQDMVDYQNPFREFPHQKFASLVGCKYGPHAAGPTIATSGYTNPFIAYTAYNEFSNDQLAVGNAMTFRGAMAGTAWEGANSIATIGADTHYPTYVCRLRLLSSVNTNFRSGFLTSTDGGRTWSLNNLSNRWPEIQYLSYGSYHYYVSGLPGSYNDTKFFPICSDGTNFFVFTGTNAYGLANPIYKLGGYELDIDWVEVGNP
jgi:hypothetical protein